MFNPSSLSKPLVLVRCRHRVVRPWYTRHPPDEQLLISVGWVLRRPSSLLSRCHSPPCCPFLPVPVPIVVVVSGGSFLAWCSPSLASNTHNPPCEQLLTGVGAGAGSSVVVGVFCGCLSLVALALGSWSSSLPIVSPPLHCHRRSTRVPPRAVARGAGGGWCIVRHHRWSWWGPSARFHHRHLL
jgi:hypothetical protein